MRQLFAEIGRYVSRNTNQGSGVCGGGLRTPRPRRGDARAAPFDRAQPPLGGKCLIAGITRLKFPAAADASTDDPLRFSEIQAVEHVGAAADKSGAVRKWPRNSAARCGRDRHPTSTGRGRPHRHRIECRQVENRRFPGFPSPEVPECTVQKGQPLGATAEVFVHGGDRAGRTTPDPDPPHIPDRTGWRAGRSANRPSPAPRSRAERCRCRRRPGPPRSSPPATPASPDPG
jgi:hypothetical protein